VVEVRPVGLVGARESSASLIAAVRPKGALMTLLASLDRFFSGVAVAVTLVHAAAINAGRVQLLELNSWQCGSRFERRGRLCLDL
jgi:hypothetical protein